MVPQFQVLWVWSDHYWAGIYEQSMGAVEPSRNRVILPARQATKAGGIDSLESIPGLLKSLKTGLLTHVESKLL
jgi:hypothetical protein